MMCAPSLLSSLLSAPDDDAIVRARVRARLRVDASSCSQAIFPREFVLAAVCMFRAWDGLGRR